MLFCGVSKFAIDKATGAHSDQMCSRHAWIQRLGFLLLFHLSMSTLVHDS